MNGSAKNDATFILPATPRHPISYAIPSTNQASLPAVDAAAIVVMDDIAVSDYGNGANKLVVFELPPCNQAILQFITSHATSNASLTGNAVRVWLGRQSSCIEKGGKVEVQCGHAFDVNVETTAAPPAVPSTSMHHTSGGAEAIADALSTTNSHLPSPSPVVIFGNQGVMFDTYGARWLVMAVLNSTSASIRIGVQPL